LATAVRRRTLEAVPDRSPVARDADDFAAIRALLVPAPASVELTQVGADLQRIKDRLQHFHEARERVLRDMRELSRRTSH
jgi:hypothetical protein